MKGGIIGMGDFGCVGERGLSGAVGLVFDFTPLVWCQPLSFVSSIATSGLTFMLSMVITEAMKECADEVIQNLAFFRGRKGGPFI